MSAVVTAIAMAPVLLLGIPAGAIADRSSRVRMLRIAEVASTAITLMLVVVLMVFGFVSPIVLTFVALLSIFAVFFDAGSFGVLPTLVPKERIGQANGLLYGNNTVISLVSPVVAGYLYSTVGLTAVLIINAVTFAISAALLLTLPKDQPEGGSVGDKLRSMPSDMAEGLAVIWRSHLLRFLVFSGAATAIAGGALSACMIIIATERFDADGKLVGMFISATGAGAFIASLVLSFLSERVSQSRITIVAMLAGVLSFAGTALARTPILMIVFCIAWGLCYTVLIINNVTIRQTILPHTYQARVNSTARTIAWGGEPVGAGLAALLLAYGPDHVVLLIASIPFVIVTMMAPFTALKSRELTPIPEPAI